MGKVLFLLFQTSCHLSRICALLLWLGPPTCGFGGYGVFLSVDLVNYVVRLSRYKLCYSFICLTNICGPLFCPSIVLSDGDKTLTIGAVPNLRSSSILCPLGWEMVSRVHQLWSLHPMLLLCGRMFYQHPHGAESWGSLERPRQKVAQHGWPQEQGESGALGWGEWRAGLAATVGWDSKPSPPDPPPPLSSPPFLPCLLRPATQVMVPLCLSSTHPGPSMPDLPAATTGLFI